MKKILIFIFIVLILIVFSSSACAWELPFDFGDFGSPDDVPALMQSSRNLVQLANDTYKYSLNLYEQTGINSENTVLDLNAIERIAYQLLVLFLMANLYRKYEHLGRLSLATVFPVLIFYGVGFAVISNVDLVFDFAQSLTEVMIGGISGGETEELYDFQVMLDHYESIDFGTLGLGFFVKVYYSIIYYIVGWIALISSLFVNALLLIRQFKILILRLVAPVMLVGFTNPKTSHFSFNFVKKVVMVHLELFYLQAIIALFVSFMGTQSSFFMLIVMAIGLIVALFGQTKLLNFLS
jgi:hypothetical protein